MTEQSAYVTANIATTKFYQVINFQSQPIATFKIQANAVEHADKLIKQYPDEGFYVVELTVVHIVGEVEK